MLSTHLESELKKLFGNRAKVSLVDGNTIRVELDIEFQESDWSDEFRVAVYKLLGHCWAYEIGDDGNLDITAKAGCRL